MEVKKIMCACGTGVGTSLLVEMNIKAVLKELGVEGVEVIHSITSDVRPGAADLFIVGHDLEAFCKKVPGDCVISLINIVDKAELKEKLSARLSS